MSKTKLTNATIKALHNLAFRMGDSVCKIGLVRSSIMGAHAVLFIELGNRGTDIHAGDPNYSNPAYGAACSLELLGDTLAAELNKLNEMQTALESLRGGDYAAFEQKYRTLRA